MQPSGSQHSNPITVIKKSGGTRRRPVTRSHSLLSVQSASDSSQTLSTSGTFTHLKVAQLLTQTQTAAAKHAR